MTSLAITQGLILGLVLLFAPLSLVWAYALYDSLRRVFSGEPAVPDSAPPSESLGWPVLLLLTGFFGGIAYLFLVVLPRLQRPRARLRLQSVTAMSGASWRQVDTSGSVC